MDSKSKLNGQILAMSQAAGSLGSYCAVYIENKATRSGLLIYVLGSALMGIICLSMGVFVKIWAAYSLYITISGIYQTLACLVSVRCSRLLSNGQFMLLFSINNFVGLLIETLVQAAVVSMAFHCRFPSTSASHEMLCIFIQGMTHCQPRTEYLKRICYIEMYEYELKKEGNKTIYFFL